MAGTENSPAKRGAGSRILRLLLVGFIGIIVAATLLIAMPPAGLIKDEIEKAASASTGRAVTIGNADIKLWPLPSIRLHDVAVASPNGAAEVFQAQDINARLKLWPLLSGKAEIDSLEIIKPNINLVTDAAGKNNWTLAANGKNPAAPAVVLLNGATVKDGQISYTQAGSKEPLQFEHVDATIEAGGGANAKGSLKRKGESAKVDIALSDLIGALSDKPTDVKIAIDGKSIKGQFSGVATTAAPQELTGAVALNSASVGELARWLGSDMAAGSGQTAGSLTGKIKATQSSVTFDGTEVAIGADTGKLNGKLALDGPRPKYEGAIAVPRIDLNALLGGGASSSQAAGPVAGDDLELETAPAWDGLRDTLQNLAAGAAPEASASKTVSTAKSAPSPWSQTPIDLKVLQSADLDAVITADQLVLGRLDLKNAQINAKLTNGKLDAKLEKLAIGAGSATGKLSLDSSKAVPHADVALNLVNVAAEPIITEITGKPLLVGTSNVDITATGDGRSQLALASSIEGKAKFHMSKGVIRGFDVRAIMSNWWSSLTGGLKFDINKKTGFEKLDAQYDIKKGLMTSSPGLDIGGSEVEVQSRGNVSLPAKLINQEIRVKVVPPPSAPPIPVKISGNWAKPSISMDWGDLLFSSGVSAPSVSSSAASGGESNTAAPSAEDESIAGGFKELAPKAEDVPDDVKAKIKAVLASEHAKSITPEGKALLETLLAANPANPAPAVNPAVAPAVEKPALAPEAAPTQPEPSAAPDTPPDSPETPSAPAPAEPSAAPAPETPATP